MNVTYRSIYPAIVCETCVSKHDIHRKNKRKLKSPYIVAACIGIVTYAFDLKTTNYYIPTENRLVFIRTAARHL